MGAGRIVLIGLRVIALLGTLIVIGLSVWSKFVEHDIEMRGSAVLQRLKPEELVAQEWREFFVQATGGTTRIWITIVAASVTFLTSLLVFFANIIQRFEMPSSIVVPIEVLSTSAMATAFGCSLSFAYSLLAFTREQLETADSADLTAFTMILPLSRGLVVTTNITAFILLTTTITATVQACTRAREGGSCSFEPTASALGMGHDYMAIEPPTVRSRPPTLYDPRKPLPKQLDGMPQNEEEESLVVQIAPPPRRADSILSDSSIYSRDMEKEETWPLNADKPQVLSIRPSRPWSEMPKKAYGHGSHAM